jgi:hypothetical protein
MHEHGLWAFLSEQLGGRKTGPRAGRSASSLALVFLLAIGLACDDQGESDSGGSGATNYYCGLSTVDEDCTGQPGLAGAYILEQYALGDDWGADIPDTLAVDSQERLFVTDGFQIFVVEAGVVSVWLTTAEVSAVTGGGVRHMTVGGDDQLYFRGGGAFGVSNAPNSASLVVDTGQLFLKTIQAIDATQLYTADFNAGIYSVTVGGATQLYDATDLNITQGGDNEDFRIDATNGEFYFLSGGFTADLYKGALDGSGAAFFLAENDFDNSYFHGLGFRPGGGVFLSLGNKIVAVDPDGSYTQITITPTIDALVLNSLGHISTFVDNSLAVSVNGVIYAHSEGPTGTEIFRMTPTN